MTLAQTKHTSGLKVDPSCSRPLILGQIWISPNRGTDSIVELVRFRLMNDMQQSLRVSLGSKTCVGASLGENRISRLYSRFRRQGRGQSRRARLQYLPDLYKEPETVEAQGPHVGGDKSLRREGE